MSASKLKDANIATQSVLKDEIISAQNSIFYTVANSLGCLDTLLEKVKHEKENSIIAYDDFVKLKNEIKLLSNVQKWHSLSNSSNEYFCLIKRNNELLEMLNPE